MTITNQDAEKLRNSGFTEREIDTLRNAVNPDGKPQPPVDLTSKAWAASIQARERFADNARNTYRMTHNGRYLERERYDALADSVFKGNMFDWLKLTYKPKSRTDFQTALHARENRKRDALRKRFSRGSY